MKFIDRQTKKRPRGKRRGVIQQSFDNRGACPAFNRHLRRWSNLILVGIIIGCAYFNRIFSTWRVNRRYKFLLLCMKKVRESTFSFFFFFFVNPCPLMNEFLIFYTPSYRVWPGRRARTVFRYIIFYFLSISLYYISLLSASLFLSFHILSFIHVAFYVYISPPPFVMLFMLFFTRARWTTAKSCF